MATEPTPEEAALVGKQGSARNFTQVEADALNKAIAAGGSAGGAGFQAALARNQDAAVKSAEDIGRSASAIQAADPAILAELAGIVNPVFEQAETELGAREASTGQAFSDLQALSTDFTGAAQAALPISQAQADAARMLAEGQALAAATRGEFDLKRTLAQSQNERLRLALQRAELERQADPDNLAAQIQNMGGLPVLEIMASGIKRQNPDLAPDELGRLFSQQTGLPEEFARGLFDPTSSILETAATVGQATQDATELEGLLENVLSSGGRNIAGSFDITGSGATDAGFIREGVEATGLKSRFFGDLSDGEAKKLVEEGVSEEVPGGIVQEIVAQAGAFIEQAQDAGEPIDRALLVDAVAGRFPGVSPLLIEFVMGNVNLGV